MYLRTSTWYSRLLALKIVKLSEARNIREVCKYGTMTEYMSVISGKEKLGRKF